MAGVLRKDWYCLVEYSRRWLLLGLVLCLITGPFGGAYAMMLSMALPRNIISADEGRWDRYAAMLPCRAEEIVGCKYLICGLCAAVGAVLLALSFPMQEMAAALLRQAQGSGGTRLWNMSWQGILEYTLLETALTILIAATSLPLFYRFGVRRGQIWANVLTQLSLYMIGAQLFRVLSFRPAGERAAAVGLLLALAAATLLLSFRLSVRFYRRRLRQVYL